MERMGLTPDWIIQVKSSLAHCGALPLVRPCCFLGKPCMWPSLKGEPCRCTDAAWPDVACICK